MADMMYRLVLSAQFNDASELDRVTQGLQQLQVQGANVSVKMGQMGSASSDSLQSIARSAMSVGFMFNMMESAMMRQEMATRQLNTAQEEYNKTVQKYGINSQQARDAAQRLTEQQQYLNEANMREYVSEGLMIANLVIQSGLLKQATWDRIAKTAATVQDTAAETLNTVALEAQNAALTIWDALTQNWVAIAAAATVATAVGVGAYEASQGNIHITAPVTINNNLDNALQQQNNEIKNQVKRASP